MTTQLVAGIEVDTCGQCGGILLDKGETEDIEHLGVAKIVEDATEAAVTATPTREGSARCHECDADMIPLTGAGDIEYDWCSTCERLFFDRGELAALEAFRSD